MIATYRRSAAVAIRRMSTAVASAPGAKPAVKPVTPNFSSGPCAKRPGYNLPALSDAPLGRSHRAKCGKDKLGGAIQMTRDLLDGEVHATSETAGTWRHSGAAWVRAGGSPLNTDGPSEPILLG